MICLMIIKLKYSYIISTKNTQKPFFTFLLKYCF